MTTESAPSGLSGQRGFGPSALATPANALTIGRLLAAPVLFAVIVASPRSWVTFTLGFLLAATDGIDGFVARRQGTTRSGAFLDPLADKCLILGAMAALVVKNQLWWLPVAVIAFREAAVSVYRSYAGRVGVSVPARPWAKVKTLVQDVAVGVALFPAGGDHRRVAGAVLWAAAALTLVTGAQYLLDGRKVLREL